MSESVDICRMSNFETYVAAGDMSCENAASPGCGPTLCEWRPSLFFCLSFFFGPPTRELPFVYASGPRQGIAPTMPRRSSARNRKPRSSVGPSDRVGCRGRCVACRTGVACAVWASRTRNTEPAEPHRTLNEHTLRTGHLAACLCAHIRMLYDISKSKNSSPSRDRRGRTCRLLRGLPLRAPARPSAAAGWPVGGSVSRRSRGLRGHMTWPPTCCSISLRSARRRSLSGSSSTARA